MFSNKEKFKFIWRLDQIGVALIPLTIGLLAFLNDAGMFTSTVDSTIKPLIGMENNSSHQNWRALPLSWANYIYTFMFCAEFLMGILAFFGIVNMLKNINKEKEKFDESKKWLFLACGWGIIIWGLGFFEIGGDWFLAWMNNSLSSFQQESLNYVLEIFVVFVYLKLS